jgi:diguanylate cyclase (GGDEF)-like protein
LQPILQSLAELAGAALGNVADKCSMKRDAAESACETKEVARQLSETIQDHNEAMQEKDRIATTDVLTGLLNRRGFFERAEQAMKVARRKEMRCMVVFADLDDLKAVNDTLGHDTGDRLLRAAGEVFAASFRDSDVVARLGGDEFSAFVIDTVSEAAVLDRVSDSVSRFHRRTTTPYRVSFSIGVVECDLNSPQSLENYLITADNRMYQSKRANRC